MKKITEWSMSSQRENPVSSIKKWPSTERPREKLLKYGPDVLSDAELLAIFLRTGVPGTNVVDLAREMWNTAGGLRSLMNQSEQDLCSSRGIGSAKYVQLQAALEIGRRYLRERL